MLDSIDNLADFDYSDALARLVERGWAVIPEFVDANTCRELVEEIEALAEAGEMHTSRVGRGLSREVRADIRSDLIHWIDEDTATKVQRKIWGQLDELRTELNRRLFLGLRSYEGHLAVYPVGARYAKHIDNFQRSSARLVSSIVYLNDMLDPGDGGQLRIYDRDNIDVVATEITPREGTLAIFVSAEIPHEVLQAGKRRYSFTGWFLDHF